MRIGPKPPFPTCCMTFHTTIFHALASRLVVRCRILLTLLLSTIVAIVLCAASTAPAEAQQQQLQLLQPNGAERLQSGSEYTIRWTGIDPAQTVRLEYSTDGGASWKLITAAARGGAYVWKPVPNEPSDSCLVLVSGLAGDSSKPVSGSIVSFMLDRSGISSLSRPAEQLSFSPDGSKILVTLWSDPVIVFNTNRGFSKYNVEVRDGKTGAVLYKLPEYISTAGKYGNRYWTFGLLGGYGGGYDNNLFQSRWSPDNASFLSYVNDSTLGVFDAQTGMLRQSITVPRLGEVTKISSFQWAAGGSEIVSTVSYGRPGPQINGLLDTVNIMMMRFSASTGALTNTPYRVGGIIPNRLQCSSTYNYGNNAFALLSYDGERRVDYFSDSLQCLSGIVIRNTRDNSVLHTVAGVTNGNWGGTGWASNLWSPSDSLVIIYENGTQFVVYNAITGTLVRRVSLPSVSTRYYQWSPDSRSLLIDAPILNRLPFADQQHIVLNVYSGVVTTTLRKMQGWESASVSSGASFFNGGIYGGDWWGGNTNTGASGNSSTAWSPDSRYVAGFLWQDRSKYSPIDNVTNTVGIWNARTGCLMQTFNLLPFPDDSGIATKRSFFQRSVQWSADGKRLLLFSPFAYTAYTVRPLRPNAYTYQQARHEGIPVIVNVNVQDIPCQEDVSDTLWTILPRGTLRLTQPVFAPVQCGATSASASFTVTNTSTRSLTIGIPTIAGANAEDFIMQPVSTASVAAGATISTITLGTTFQTNRQAFTVVFTPRPGAFGERRGLLVFSDATGNPLDTVQLTARYDTFSIAPADIRFNLGRVLQNEPTSASVLLRNTGTAPLVWNVPNAGSTLFQGVAGRFAVDSIVPYVMLPGDTARAYVSLTAAATATEGAMRDSVVILRCGASDYSIALSATVVPNAPRMVVDTVLSFGRLVCEPSSDATLIVRNTGGRPLILQPSPIVDPAAPLSGGSRVYKSGMDAVPPIVVPPLGSVPLTIRFTPGGLTAAALRALGGVVEHFFVLNSNDPVQRRVTVRLRGRKTLFEYTWNPDVLNFGNVPFGASRTTTTTFTNNSTEAYFWQTLPQELSPDFVLESVEPRTIPAGSTATVSIRFRGRRNAGIASITPTLTLNDACRTTTQFSLVARVLDPQPRIVVTDTVRLAALTCATETRETITIRNDGDAELGINTVTIIGADSLDFPYDEKSLAATTVSPNGSTTFTVLFQPLGTGNRTATLLLRTNDTATARNGEVRIILAGRKDSVGAALNRPPRELTTVDEFTPLFDTLTVQNTGTVPLSWTGAAEAFPRTPTIIIDSNFSIQSIEPPVTPPGSTSRVIVRFAGGAAGRPVAERQTMLEAASTVQPLCSRSIPLTLRGTVLKQPRLGVILPASARLLCSNDTTLTVRLASVGTEDVMVSDAVQILDDAAGVFRILSSPTRIQARTGMDNVRISVQALRTGTFTARLRIRSNAANTPDTSVALTIRKDSSGLRLLPATVNFAALAENMAASRTVTVVNTGTIEQRFRLPVQGSGAFAGAFVLDSLGANPLPANSQAQARVRFAGSAGGVSRDTLRFMDSCGRVLALPLEARVIAALAVLPETVAIQLGAVEEVPVFLRERRGVEAGMEATFRLHIANASLLDIVSPTPDSSRFERLNEMVSQTLTFRARTVDAVETEPLFRLRVRSLLGSATTTTVRLENVSVGGVPVRNAAAPMLYRTRGINYAGGAPRLIYTPNLLSITLAPNPVGDELTIVTEMKESASVAVQAVDVLGMRHTLYVGERAAGVSTLRLPVTTLASGVYVVEVRVGAGQVSRMMTVMR
jgi:hypothetical protein